MSPDYRRTSLTRKRTPLGPYRRPMTRVLGGSQGVGRFLMGEVPLYRRKWRLLRRRNALRRKYRYTPHPELFFFFFVTLKPRVE